MNKEKINDFTRRISTGNRTGLTVIVYEIMNEYFQDAYAAKENNDADAFKTAVRKADSCIAHLMDELDFKYELSSKLYSEYMFCRKHLAFAMMRFSEKEVRDVEKILKPLHEAFVEISKIDDTPPVMANAENVYAGMTYGKGTLNESSDITNGGRGFYA
ncbi:MAG: flagellar protein FliS [Lachnospiraceae bacterium]|nr:flagellar protein FliS [Lachnospiraceae bacterium]